MLWTLLGRYCQISKRRRNRCHSVLIVRRPCPNPVGTAWIAPVSFGAWVSSKSSPPLTQPLAEERFICDDCEYKSLAFNEIHTKKHTLVRVVEKVVETVASTEERLRAVEGQLESVQAKMEELLSRFLGNGTEGSPDEAITQRGVQLVVEGSNNTESDNREAKDQEATITTTTDNH